MQGFNDSTMPPHGVHGADEDVVNCLHCIAAVVVVVVVVVVGVGGSGWWLAIAGLLFCFDDAQDRTVHSGELTALNGVAIQ